MSSPRPKSDPPAVQYGEPHFTFRVLGRVKPTHDPKCPTPFGYCWKGYGDIHVDPRQSEEEMIDTVAHELLHDALPYLDEEAVEKAANRIASAMWKLGYRRTVIQ
jgi:hypothetical protein